MQLADDARGIGDNRQALALREAPRQLEDCGAAFEEDGFAVEHKLFRGLRDLQLFLGLAVQERVVGGLEVGAGHARDGAAVRADQHAFELQRLEIASNGDRRDIEALAQVLGADGALGGQNLANLETTFFCKHVQVVSLTSVA